LYLRRHQQQVIHVGHCRLYCLLGLWPLHLLLGRPTILLSQCIHTLVWEWIYHLFLINAAFSFVWRSEVFRKPCVTHPAHVLTSVHQPAHALNKHTQEQVQTAWMFRRRGAIIRELSEHRSKKANNISCWLIITLVFSELNLKPLKHVELQDIELCLSVLTSISAAVPVRPHFNFCCCACPSWLHFLLLCLSVFTSLSAAVPVRPHFTFCYCACPSSFQLLLLCLSVFTSLSAAVPVRLHSTFCCCACPSSLHFLLLCLSVFTSLSAAVPVRLHFTFCCCACPSSLHFLLLCLSVFTPLSAAVSLRSALDYHFMLSLVICTHVSEGSASGNKWFKFVRLLSNEIQGVASHNNVVLFSPVVRN
jgi:hypothetical protein